VRVGRNQLQNCVHNSPERSVREGKSFSVRIKTGVSHHGVTARPDMHLPTSCTTRHYHAGCAAGIIAGCKLSEARMP